MMDLGNLDYLNPVFFFGNVIPKYFRPTFSVGTVADIDLGLLESMGVRAFVFDVDNTICSHHGIELDGRVRDAFRRITGRYPSCLLSNAAGARSAEIRRFFGVPVVASRYRKPKPAAFMEALAFLGTKPEETAVVGDRIMTDIVGANNAGCVSIKVEPLKPSSEPLPLRVSRSLEDALYAFYRKVGF